MEYNYSVVIPHKNAPHLLKRCVDSIPCRNDIQIIIVDDNSDLNIVDFDKLDFSNHPNIEIILTKEAKGAGYARNVGLRKSRGKWLLFADCDDFYDQRAFTVFDKNINLDVDIFFFNVYSVDTDTLKKSNRDKNYGKYIERFLNGKEPQADSIRFLKWEPWFKMFNRDFVIRNNIQFEEIPRCNDMSFNLQAAYFAKKFGATKEKLYCVTTNPTSITKHKIEKEAFWHCILCEMKKNFLYEIVGHNNWKSTYIFITVCLLKNNGLFETLEFIKMLFDRRAELKDYSRSLKTFFRQ